MSDQEIPSIDQIIRFWARENINMYMDGRTRLDAFNILIGTFRKYGYGKGDFYFPSIKNKILKIVTRDTSKKLQVWQELSEDDWEFAIDQHFGPPIDTKNAAKPTYTVEQVKQIREKIKEEAPPEKVENSVPPADNVLYSIPITGDPLEALREDDE